jgi:hypothetical protein
MFTYTLNIVGLIQCWLVQCTFNLDFTWRDSFIIMTIICFIYELHNELEGKSKINLCPQYLCVKNQ